MYIPILSPIIGWWYRSIQADNFEVTFGFRPKLLKHDSYRREVLFKLGRLAKEVAPVARKYASNEDFVGNYRIVFRKFNEALLLVRFFDPDFAETIPHWSQLPDQLEALIKGEELPLSESLEEFSDHEIGEEHHPQPKSLFT